MNKIGEAEVQYVLSLLYPNDIFYASECPDIKQYRPNCTVPHSGIEVVTNSVFSRDELIKMYRYNKENHPTTMQFIEKFNIRKTDFASWHINILRCIMKKVLLIHNPYYTQYKKMSIACILCDFTHDVSPCDELYKFRRYVQDGISTLLASYIPVLCELYHVDKIYLVFINDAFLSSLDAEYILHGLHYGTHGHVYTYDKMGMVSYMSRKF